MTEQTPEFKKKTFIAWLTLVGLALSFYFTHRETLDVEVIRALVNENRILVIPTYLLVLSFLGLTFIPSTPFAIGGVLLFLSRPPVPDDFDHDCYGPHDSESNR